MIATTTLLLFLAPPTPCPQDSIDGRWAGCYREQNEEVSVEIDFRVDGDELDAIVRLPERGYRIEAQAECEGSSVSVLVLDEDGEVKAELRGEHDGSVLRGRLDGVAATGQVELSFVRIEPLGDALRERYQGTYRLDEETMLRIVPVRRALDEVLAIEFPAENLRSLLFPQSETRMLAGAREQPLPVTATLDFQTDAAGSVEALELTLGDTTLVAEPMNAAETNAADALPSFTRDIGVERREVRIDAGDVTLAGTLYFPPGVERPCPAVVQLHGSAPTKHQDQWHFFTATALRSGLAVLAFDKRGCGQSTGTFRSFTVASSAKLFDTLSDDGAAVHAFLRKQEGIDPERVGLIGGSQAGWIMPLIADKAEGVRFIVSGCGPPVSAGEEQYHAVQLDKGLSVYEADRRLEDWRGRRGYDPRKLLRRLDTPILWLFGEKDDVIPTSACLTEIAKLREEGHVQHDLHVFPDTDHNFQTSRGDGVLLEPVILRWFAERGILD